MEDLGGPTTFNHYPIGWAHAMDTPFQWTKQVASHFGGTRNGRRSRASDLYFLGECGCTPTWPTNSTWAWISTRVIVPVHQCYVQECMLRPPLKTSDKRQMF